MDDLQRMQWLNTGISAQDYDPMAFAKLKADSFNKTHGNLTGTDCPVCLNKGNIMVPREDGSLASRECKCMVIRRCVWKMERSGLKNVIKNYTFDRFTETEEWQKRALAAATNYAKNPEDWFVICGQSGSGKTHLCTAICRELLLNGRQVVYAPWRQEIAEIKAMSLDAEGRTQKMDSLKKAEVLYIDDLFKAGAGQDGEARPTGADISIAFEIINARYVSRLPTIISTELLPEELVKLDEAVGGRIVEMAGVYAISISRNTGRNYRLRGVVNV